MDTNTVSCLEWYYLVRLVRLLFLPPMRFPINTIISPGYAPNIDRIDQINYSERIKWGFDFTTAFVRASKFRLKGNRWLVAHVHSKNALKMKFLHSVDYLLILTWMTSGYEFGIACACCFDTEEDAYSPSKSSVHRPVCSVNVIQAAKGIVANFQWMFTNAQIENNYSDMKWIHSARI